MIANTVSYTIMTSPLGEILLARNRFGLTFISFLEGTAARNPKPEWKREMGPLRDAVEQLKAYFKGDLKRFDLPLAPEGTAFQQKVWNALRRIPYGETLSYGELAERIGTPKASRAVGAANGKNPLPIVVPCHRVIGRHGKLTGYAGGIAIKKTLLEHEKNSLKGSDAFEDLP